MLLRGEPPDGPATDEAAVTAAAPPDEAARSVPPEPLLDGRVYGGALRGPRSGLVGLVMGELAPVLARETGPDLIGRGAGDPR
mmetsp:Transcript_24655/g.39078  ORF Transcript_24655/g.39078 Transcript_24655/m.39078 type:complete len:83 (-) Transcript_24655:1425-1673(-)